MRFLVLGGGAQGSAAAFELCQRAEVEQVVLVDQKVAGVRPFLERFLDGKLRLEAVNAADNAAVGRLMDSADAAVCALPYYLNYDMARLAVQAGVHYCDLGGNTEIVDRQRGLDEEARKAGVSVIPDCGLAPGMVNILAQAGIDALDETRSVKIRVGGLPRDPKPPLNYRIVYSLQGVLDYYTTRSIVLEDGEVVEKEALSEVEPVHFHEVGELEAFHTAGGISSMPHRYRGRIPHMEYKTLRYPGHARIMRAIRELGLLSEEPVEHRGHRIAPRDFFIDVVSPRLRDPEGRDMVVLRVEVEGTRDGGEWTIRYDLLDHHDPESGLTAMMRTTGYSLAVTGVMQVDGRIVEKGVRTPDECVPAGPYIEELARRGICIERAEGVSTVGAEVGR